MTRCGGSIVISFLQLHDGLLDESWVQTREPRQVLQEDSFLCGEAAEESKVDHDMTPEPAAG